AADPSFTRHVIGVTAGQPLSVAAGDVNSDGHLDVVITDYSDNSVLWYESDGAADPGFTPHVITDALSKPFPAAVADVNGDGRPPPPSPRTSSAARPTWHSRWRRRTSTATATKTSWPPPSSTPRSPGIATTCRTAAPPSRSKPSSARNRSSSAWRWATSTATG